jgi:tetratricopeptide (TPR) repeat protein
MPGRKQFNGSQTTPSLNRLHSPDDTLKAARPKSSARAIWPWLIFMFVFVFLVLGVSAVTGYKSGLGNQQLAQTQTVAQLGQEQFDLGVEDFLASRYELASQRFEYVLSLDPTNPDAFELLSKSLEAMNQPTPTPIPVASPTPTETPDLGSYEGIFQSAQTAFNRADWGGALDMLILLRGQDPNYRLAEVNQMMAVALRNRGMDKLFQSHLEQGIYDLSLASRFGSLDNQALSWRRSAEFYLLANRSVWRISGAHVENMPNLHTSMPTC